MSPLAVFLLSVAFAAVPAALYAFLIWWIDWYERESPKLVVLGFAWGAIVAAGFGAFAEVVLNVPLQIILNPSAADFLLITFAAPVIEELIKGALLLLILHAAEFDNLTDGIVYGAVIGLGFSLSENVAYFYSAYTEGGALAWLGNILFRSAFCCTLHATATSFTGAAIGFAKFSRRRSRAVIMSLGFAAAIAVHMGWNGFLSLGDIFRVSALYLVSLAGLPVAMLVVAFLFWWSLNREKEIIVKELAEEAQSGWLPPEHAAILPHLTKRLRPGWLPEGVDQSAYVKTMTELAFRRHQSRYVSSRKKAHYEWMVNMLRTTAQQMLGIVTPPAEAASPSPAPSSPAPDGPLSSQDPQVFRK